MNAINVIFGAVVAMKSKYALEVEGKRKRARGKREIVAMTTGHVTL